MIQPIYKNKGPRNDPDNYRGISLLSCVAKLFTACVNSRLSLFLEENDLIKENQAGFRNGYSTTDHIFSLHSIIDLYLRKKKRIYAAFIDYRKAFDLVHRASLWKKLMLHQINGNILKLIYSIYENAKSCVKVGNTFSRFFPCKTGVRQGDNLSPLLFSIYLNDFEDFLFKKYKGLDDLANDIDQMSNDQNLTVFLRLYILLYADDTVILAETEKELQLALDSLEEYCSLWNLQVNLDKTKVVIFSRGKIRKFRKFTFAGEQVEVVPEYIYLGIVMNYNNKFNKAIERLCMLARKAIFSLKSKILNLNLPIDLQIDL